MKIKEIITLILIPLFAFSQSAEHTSQFLEHKSKYLELSKLPNSFGNDTLMLNELDSMRFYLTKTEPKHLKDIDVNSLIKLIANNHKNWPKGLAISNLWEGINLSENNSHIRALQKLKLAANQFHIVKDFKHEAFTLIKLGLIVSMHYSNFEKSINYIENGLKIAKKYKYPSVIFYGLNAKGTFYSNIGKNKSALDVFLEFDNLNDPNFTNNLSNKLNIGVEYLHLDSLDKALKYLLPSLKKLPSITSHEKYVHWSINEELVAYYFKKKNYSLAQKYLKVVKQNYIYANVDKWAYYDYQIQKGLGNTNLALFYLEKFRNFELEEKANEQKNKLDGISSQLALKEQNEKLQKSENEKLRTSNEKKNQIQWFLISIGVIGFFSTLYIFYTNRKLKANNEALFQKNKEISEAMLQGQTTERKRVAADLHDNLGSTLSSIKWSLQAIDKSKMDTLELEVHQNLSEMLEKAYNDVRFLSHNLLPEEFEKQGLVSSLKYFVRKINQNSIIKFELDIDENLGRFDKKIEFELYSICLELVTNILKHSKATEAKIALQSIENAIFMEITDNGQGVFVNLSDGRGLKNVQARVDSLGGTWNMKNATGQGVKSIVKIII